MIIYKLIKQFNNNLWWFIMKMQTGQFKEMLKTKPDIFELADQCINNPDQITMLFDIINTEKSSIKFTCVKTIRIISDIEPSAL